MGLPQLWQYFHKMDGNVCLQWTVPHPARPDNQFKQVSRRARVPWTLFRWVRRAGKYPRPAGPRC
jgi:hypothetical protein